MLKKFLIALVFAFSLLFLAPSAHASTLYLSPGSASIPQGGVVSVAVGLNTGGESVNGVSAYLAYPADKLEVAWISYGGSFSIAAEGAYGGGGIRISRGSISGVVGSVNVATIGFRGVAQGAATVSFIGGSGAPRASDSSDSLNLGGSAGGTFTVVAGVPGGQTGATTGSAALPAAKDQTAPVISSISATLISTVSATISWTTDEKADSTVEYGLSSGKYFLSIRDQVLTTDHVLKIEGTALTPGALFHFRVKSKDAAGNEGISSDRTFQLKGYNVTIKILDTDNKPIANAEVLFYGAPDKAQTSPTGEVSFANVTQGKHLVVIKIKNGSDKTGEINVQDAPLAQIFTLNINTSLSQTDYLYLSLAVAGLIGVVALVIVIIVILKKRRNSPIDNPQPPVQTPGV